MIRSFAIWACLLTTVIAADPPRIVATPPADGGRGLVRVSETEIRHYAGKGRKHYLRSMDNGETWSDADLPASFPLATSMGKEAPAIGRNPNSGEFLRIAAIYRGGESEGMHLSKGGLDGEWTRIVDGDGKPILLKGILRSPLWVNGGKRVLVPGHGGGSWTWYSDDQGMSWQRSNKVQAPSHQIGGVHKGVRWNHGIVEATIVEKNDKTLWMVARTAQDQHWESFSKDFGTTWSVGKPSRFWGTITMPTFFRMDDGRLLMLWSNTTPLPEVEQERVTGWEDVFTNRDAIHAAISEDDGETWVGFREIILDELRNNPDYGVKNGANDRGKHQSEVVQLDANRVLLSCGQHPLHRRLMIMDVRWLYETERRSDLAKDGTRDWSTHQYVDKIVGHCSYNRKPGAPVEGGALRVRRVDDPTLTSQNQGAVWNFPAGHAGSVKVKMRLEPGGVGMQLALCDRWFNPTDATVDQFANYVVKIDGEGRASDGTQLLTPGEVHTLEIGWSANGEATVWGVNRVSGLELQHPCPNGVSYLHAYNPAAATDLAGFSIFSTDAKVVRPVVEP